MRIIICVDDNGGMLFNSRRQSRDRALIADVMSRLGDKKIYISDFSRLLFEAYEDGYVINNDIPKGLKSEDVCFVENIDVKPYIDSIDEITVYRWNRLYPNDFSFDIDLQEEGFALRSSCDFEGYSHEKITREVYER